MLARFHLVLRGRRQCQGGLVVWLLLFCAIGHAAEPAGVPAGRGSDKTNSFPELNEVFQGRVFKSNFERDLFFLRTIHKVYAAHWVALLEANLVLDDYLRAPDKLLRFVDELGTAMQGTDDVAARTNLAAIVSDPQFYANTNAYHPEILRATAGAMIKLGPNGRRALADTFTQDHYRTDSQSLEILADAVGRAQCIHELTVYLLDYQAAVWQNVRHGT